MGKKIAILLFLLFSGLLGWKVFEALYGADEVRALNKDRPSGVAVAVVSPEYRSLREERVFSGTLRPMVRFDVASRVSSRVLDRRVDLGDPVHPGDVLIRMDEEEYRLACDQAGAELDVAKARFAAERAEAEAKKKEFERARTLLKKKMVSQARYEESETAWKTARENQKVAEAQIRQKEASLRQLKVRLRDCVLGVPEGIVSKDASLYVGACYVEPGTLVKEKEPLLTLLGISRLKALIYVTEKDYALIRPGMTGVLRVDAHAGKSFPCRVKRVAPLVEEESRQALVELEVPNQELLLRPGMFVRVTLVLREKDSVLTVPLDALCDREGARGVFLLDASGKRAVFQPVVLGLQEKERGEIVSPEKIEGPVVILGHHLLGAEGGVVFVPGEAPLREE